MLMEIERLMDGGTKTKQQKEKANFVQRHFDWIAGTSTGAILALALADGTPLLDCLRLYLRLKDDVFGPQAKEHFGEQRKMADLRCGKMKVFVTATKAEQIPIELVLFRNYNSPFAASDKHAPEKVRIWQAARYSSAAPTYFQSMDGLMDGGLIANNPSNELLREVYLHNEAAQLNITNERQKEIAFMLSLGTGKTPPVGVDSIDLVIEPTFSTILQSLKTLNNLKSILVEQLATSDGQVVESAQMLCHLQKVPYFRLTPQLRVDIPLDTVDNDTLVDMLWDAKVYVREQCAEDVQALIEIMQDYEGLT
uniref:PNPLA domain-containing protein n=1 Tax=Globodera rostochiensis TaxID=31243 RepID=A0A914HM85_GLORO